MKCQNDQKFILNGQGYFELKSKVVTSKANSELELHLIALHMLAGLSEANMALWASLYWPPSLTRVASVESVASLPLLELSAVPFS